MIAYLHRYFVPHSAEQGYSLAIQVDSVLGMFREVVVWNASGCETRSCGAVAALPAAGCADKRHGMRILC